MDTSRPDESLSLYRQACAAMLTGETEVALALFQASARLSAHYKTLQRWGECLVKLGRLEEAVVPLAAATTLNRQGIAPTLLAEVLLKLGQPDTAKEMIDLALKRQPHFQKAQLLVSEIDSELERYHRRFDDENDSSG